MQLFRNLHDSMLTASNTSAVEIICRMRQERMVCAQDYLEVLTEVVTRHGQQHSVKISAASKIMLMPLTAVDTDLVGVTHLFGSRWRVVPCFA